MAAVIIGPFRVHDATAAQLNDVRAVAGRLPTAMQSSAGGLVDIHFKDKPNAAPSWAIGYNISNNNFWVNPKKSSATRQYVIAHEYWHEWSRSHAAIEAQIRPLIVGQLGNTQTASWTNKADEAMAHAFASGLGFPGLQRYDFRAYIPPTSYSYMLSIINANVPNGGVVVAPPPVGGGGSGIPSGNYSNVNPNAGHAVKFLQWFNAIENLPDHNALSTWAAVVQTFRIETGDDAAANYIDQVLTDLQISKNTPMGTDLSLVMNYLTTVIGTGQRPGDVGFDIATGLTGFLSGIRDSVSHAFFFLVLIIIGLVILIAGVRAGVKRDSE